MTTNKLYTLSEFTKAGQEAIDSLETFQKMLIADGREDKDRYAKTIKDLDGYLSLFSLIQNPISSQPRHSARRRRGIWRSFSDTFILKTALRSL